MRTDKFIYKSTVFCSFFIILLFFGCINESYDSCPPGQRLLYITVRDVLTGENITGTEMLDNVALYLFDSEERFMETIQVTTDQIVNRIPVDLTDKNIDKGYAVVWANMNEDMVAVVNPLRGQLLNELSILLNPYGEYAGYYSEPSDLFYGYIPLSEKTDKWLTVTDEIDIQRKNGQLYITVRGLDYNIRSDDYFFRISTRNSGYTFEGIPIETRPNLRAAEIIKENNVCRLAAPHQIIHSALDVEITEENCIVVCFVKMENDGVDVEAVVEQELITANRDINGNFIKIESGKTTNVLMEVSSSGDLVVHVVLTPWDEIYQWTEW